MAATSTTVPSETYSTALIRLHWITALVMIAAIGGAELRELFEKGSAPRTFLMAAHISLGLSILALLAARLFARARSDVPEIVPTPHALVHLASKVVHLALYAIMLVMPVIGYLMVNAKGRAVSFFGLELPVFMAENKELAHTLEEVHETIGNIAIVLIIAHAAAAIVHHVAFKDNTLARMLPHGHHRNDAA